MIGDKVYWRCSDCGSENFSPSTLRADVCVDCADMRLQVVKWAPKASREELQGVQKALANSHGSGRGARAMKAFLSNR